VSRERSVKKLLVPGALNRYDAAFPGPEVTSKNVESHTENQDYSAPFVATAVRVAQTIDGFEDRGEVLVLAANIYAETGETELALNLTQTIDDSYQRDLALTKLASVCAAAGDEDQAESLLDTIEDEAAYGLAVEQVAAAYARSGELDKAVGIAERLRDSSSALNSIALACPSNDLLTEYVEIARSIDYPEMKAITLVELASKARTLEGQSELTELIEEAVVTAGEIDFAPQRIEARMAIAALYKNDAQLEQAAEILGQARGDCEEIEGLARDVAIEQIAAAYAELRDFNTADQLLEEIEDPFQFSHATTAVAFEHYQAGDETAAVKLLGNGLEVVKGERVYGQESLNRREGVLEQLARTWASIGRVEDALQVIESQASQEQQDATLKQIATLAAPADNPGIVFKVFEKIKDDAMRVLSEVEVVRTWARLDQLELADHLLAQASTEVAKVEHPSQRTLCLAELAHAYHVRGQTNRASENLFEALKTTTTIKGSYQQARALLGLAVKHVELARPAGEPELQILEEITNRLD
jgi:tetratricopeptide (TPR) repeat protein